jgi:hypothetical protein
MRVRDDIIQYSCIDIGVYPATMSVSPTEHDGVVVLYEQATTQDALWTSPNPFF